MIRKCLIIDNEDQTEEIEKLLRDAKNDGIELTCEQFSIGDPSYVEVLTEGEIDIKKVISEYRRRFNGDVFHLAAFDYQLDDNINGVELIRQLKANKIFRTTPKIVYSGLMDDILKTIIRDESRDNAVTRIKALVKNGVIDYIERDNRDIEIRNFFKTNIESTDLIIEEELKKFPDLIFEQNFINKNLVGKTFLEIAKHIEANDQIRNEFKKEIIQQTIAYLTEKI
jgi:CheY-like chemotaxis protein